MCGYGLLVFDTQVLGLLKRSQSFGLNKDV